MSMSIATNLKREMIRHDMTVASLSEVSGVSKASINKYLTGTIKPAGEVLEKLADALHESVEVLSFVPKRSRGGKGTVTVAYAAQRLGISEMTLRILMRRGSFPEWFGFAEKGRGKDYIYIISAEGLDLYIGERDGDV